MTETQLRIMAARLTFLEQQRLEDQVTINKLLVAMIALQRLVLGESGALPPAEETAPKLTVIQGGHDAD